MSSVISPELRIADAPEQSAGQCSEYVVSALRQTVELEGRATIAISGGSTPRLLFADMAKASLDWSRVHFFWVDERCVPPDNKDSNFKLANETLFIPAKVPAGSIHRIYGELPPPEGSSRYVAEIKKFFGLKDGELPVFDVLHRGMGPDAHTASLFPGEPLIKDETGIASNVWVEKMKMHRVTLLPGVLRAARRTVLEVAGDDKAEAVHEVLRGPEDLFKYPCQIASRDARAVWFLDKAAASKL
ncbi:MAG: 6-phosphogluconolactonase [Acidobacteriota bacterium]|nr:6-phosphogluconolactonase [Acidobacteriota bacterium]